MGTHRILRIVNVAQDNKSVEKPNVKNIALFPTSLEFLLPSL